VITDEMVEEAARRAWRSEGRASSRWDEVGPASKAMYRTEARAVLEYAAGMMRSEREANSLHVVALGPIREERLKDYRCAALPGILACYPDDAQTPEHIAGAVEAMAHAMLAAERPADAPARNESDELTMLRDLVAELQMNRTLLADGIRGAVDVLDRVDGLSEDALEAVDGLRDLLPDDKETP